MDLALASFALSALALTVALAGLARGLAARPSFRPTRRHLFPAPESMTPPWSPAEPLWVWYRRHRGAESPPRGVWRPGRP